MSFLDVRPSLQPICPWPRNAISKSQTRLHSRDLEKRYPFIIFNPNKKICNAYKLY